MFAIELYIIPRVYLYQDDIMIYAVIIMFQGQWQGHLGNISFCIQRWTDDFLQEFIHTIAGIADLLYL